MSASDKNDEPIPQWALERAKEILVIGKREVIYHRDAERRVARYIMAHEEPPTDPLLLEAREIIAKWYECDSGLGAPIYCAAWRGGQLDGLTAMKWVMAALRRGMEMAREAQP